MKTSLKLALSISVIVLYCSTAFADAAKMPPPYTGSKALETVKSLAGTWNGTVKHIDGKEEKVEVIYKVTSNGSAVIETIFTGTPMEMTSVYFDKDGTLTMTHYCSVANRPELKLTKEGKKSLSLSYAGGEGLDPKKDMHIHGLDLEIKEDGSIVQNWQGFEGGKQSHTTVLKLNKVKS